MLNVRTLIVLMAAVALIMEVTSPSNLPVGDAIANPKALVNEIYNNDTTDSVNPKASYCGGHLRNLCLRVALCGPLDVIMRQRFDRTED